MSVMEYKEQRDSQTDRPHTRCQTLSVSLCGNEQTRLENIKCLFSFAILISFSLELFDAHFLEKTTNCNPINLTQLGTEVD